MAGFSDRHSPKYSSEMHIIEAVVVDNTPKTAGPIVHNSLAGERVFFGCAVS